MLDIVEPGSETKNDIKYKKSSWKRLSFVDCYVQAKWFTALLIKFTDSERSVALSTFTAEEVWHKVEGVFPSEPVCIGVGN